MIDRENKLNLTGLNSVLQEPLRRAVSEWSPHLGDHLQGITVVGSCLHGEYQPGISDINTVLILDKIQVHTLDSLAGTLRSLVKKQHLASPLLMTPDYITRSRDVFGIEFLDFQLSHQTILGEDPFADLSFEKTDVRLQCERELKADLIRLRQGYITAGKQAILIRDVLIATVKSLAPLLRAMLWLKNQERDAGIEATFLKAAEIFEFDIAPIRTIMNWRKTKTRPKGPELHTPFEQIYALVDQLATYVDNLGGDV